MTLTQLEKYMIAEVENLHLKIDSVIEVLSSQIQNLMEYMTIPFDRIEKRLDTHHARIRNLEASL